MNRLNAKLIFESFTDDSVSFQSYAGASNLHFGQDTLQVIAAYLTMLLMSGTDSGSISMPDPYSMSIYATVIHASAGQISNLLII